MKINRSRSTGFTLVEIMIVVAIIALLAAIAIPNFVKARSASQKSACIANLKQVNGAKATWALEQKNGTKESQRRQPRRYGPLRSKPIHPGATHLSRRRHLHHRHCRQPAHLQSGQHRRSHALILEFSIPKA